MKTLFFGALLVFMTSCEKEYTCVVTIKNHSFPEQNQMFYRTIKAKSKQEANAECTKGNYSNNDWTYYNYLQWKENLTRGIY